MAKDFGISYLAGRSIRDRAGFCTRQLETGNPPKKSVGSCILEAHTVHSVYSIVRNETRHVITENGRIGLSHMLMFV